ncbi:transcriptional initiation protein Tat [Acidocella sp.]|uniref:thiosulfate dehydrogenase n=1 Tax=Acidocella sp. TaxID=50710 RepID=UPI003D0135F6
MADYEQKNRSQNANRRNLLRGIGFSVGAVGLAAALPAHASTVGPGGLETASGTALEALTKKLASLPRQRAFKAVPMVLTSPSQWDSEALNELLAYRNGPKQVWDNTDLAGPWLNLMRNAMDAQIWSWKHPDFLVVSATHGSAHLALYDQSIWDKYKFASLTDGKFSYNALLGTPDNMKDSQADFENPTGPFSPSGDSIAILQQRGVVFMACHNAIWEFSAKLIKKSINPDNLSHEALAAELTNHLIPDAILSPGVVGTIPQLQVAGFHYIAAA